jgi:CheY-like chemotaxis protein
MSRSAVALSGRRILVVEDEYLIANQLKRWLQDAGAEVIGPVPSVERALDLIEDHRLDAAVLDINLGNGDTSFPVADRLELLKVPYLFATGETQKAEASGYNEPLLAKPCSEVDLLRALVDLVAT